MANEKKGLKEFLELIIKDEELAKEVEKADEDASKIVKIAKKHGCEFTEDEYNDLLMEAVNGGISEKTKEILKTGARIIFFAVYALAYIANESNQNNCGNKF